MLIISFMLGVIATFWGLIGFAAWQYATWHASGPRGYIFNPTDGYRNPFVWIGIVTWIALWPILSLISSVHYTDWNFRDIFK